MPCIYRIINKINGHSYIGQTVQKAKDRLKRHISGAKQSASMLISRAILKHGADAFYVEVIEECSRGDLDQLEIYYIDKYHPEYNISLGGGDYRKYKTEEEAREGTKEKMLVRARRWNENNKEKRQEVNRRYSGTKNNTK